MDEDPYQQIEHTYIEHMFQRKINPLFYYGDFSISNKRPQNDLLLNKFFKFLITGGNAKMQIYGRCTQRITGIYFKSIAPASKLNKLLSNMI